MVSRSLNVFSAVRVTGTVISASTIGEDEGHLYELPLPPSLSGIVGIRRLVVSLAWFTPINPLHRDYRRAGLWVSSPESALNTDRVCADWQTVQRGTMQHEIFEGDDAVAFIDGATIRFGVNCRADAGRSYERIPYGLAVTLETAEAFCAFPSIKKSPSESPSSKRCAQNSGCSVGSQREAQAGGFPIEGVSLIESLVWNLDLPEIDRRRVVYCVTETFAKRRSIVRRDLGIVRPYAQTGRRRNGR